MFSVIMVIFFIALGVSLTFLAQQRCKTTGSGNVFYFFAIVFYITAAIWLISTTVGSYSNQLSDFTHIKQINMQISLDTERRDKLINMLKVELSKFPEIEKEIIMSIKPDIMLLSQFPNLKSNETIADMVNQIVYLENSVYERRFHLINLQRQIYYREISPWVMSSVITYADFFKGENPLAK